jgi:hypothetical protein
VAYGAPGTRITPDVSAARLGQGYWGVQPSGPLAAIPRGAKPKRGAQLGRVGRVGTSAISTTDVGSSAPRVLGVPLPSSSSLDYAHKFTTTTLLLIGVVGYLLFGPKRVPNVLSQLASRHVA